VSGVPQCHASSNLEKYISAAKRGGSDRNVPLASLSAGPHPTSLDDSDCGCDPSWPQKSQAVKFESVVIIEPFGTWTAFWEPAHRGMGARGTPGVHTSTVGPSRRPLFPLALQR